MKNMMSQNSNIYLTKGFLSFLLFLVCLFTIVLFPLICSADDMFLPKIAKHFQTKFVKKTSVDIERLKKAAQLYYIDIHAWPNDFNALKNTGYLPSDWENTNSWGNPYDMKIDGDSLYIRTQVPIENIAYTRRSVGGDIQIDEKTGMISAVVFVPISIERRSNVLIDGKRYFYEDLVVEKQLPVITLKDIYNSNSYSGISISNEHGSFFINRNIKTEDDKIKRDKLLVIDKNGDIGAASNTIKLKKLENEDASLIELSNNDYTGFFRIGANNGVAQSTALENRKFIDGSERGIPAGLQIGTLSNTPITISTGGIPSLIAKDGSIFADKIVLRGVDLGDTIEKLIEPKDVDTLVSVQKRIQELENAVTSLKTITSNMPTITSIPITVGNVGIFAYSKSQDFIPNSDKKYNIGSPDRAFKSAYIDEIHLGNSTLYVGDKAVLSSDFVRLDGRIFGSGVITDLTNASDTTIATSNAVKKYLDSNINSEVIAALEIKIGDIETKIGDIGDGTLGEYIDGKLDEIIASQNITITETIDKGNIVVGKGNGQLGGSGAVFIDTNNKVGIGGLYNPTEALDVNGSIKANSLILNASNSKKLTLKSYDTIANDLTFTFPENLGETGYVLMTDGSGNMYWGSPNFTGDSNLSNPSNMVLPKGKILIGDENNKAVDRFMKGDINLTFDGTATIQPSVISNINIKDNAAILGTKIVPDFGSQNIITSGDAEIGQILTLNSSGKKLNIKFDGYNDASNDMVLVLPKNAGLAGQVLMIDSAGAGNIKNLKWGTPEANFTLANPLIVGSAADPGRIKLNNGGIDFDLAEQIKIEVDPNNLNTLNIENKLSDGIINVTAKKINLNGDIYANGNITANKRIVLNDIDGVVRPPAQMFFKNNILYFQAPTTKFESDVIIDGNKKLYFGSLDAPSIYSTKDNNLNYKDLHIESRGNGTTGNITIKAKDGITLDSDKVAIANSDGKTAFFKVTSDGFSMISADNVKFETPKLIFDNSDFVFTKPNINFQFNLAPQYDGVDRNISFGGANLTDIDAITVKRLYVKFSEAEFVPGEAYVLWTNKDTGLASWKLAAQTSVGLWKWSDDNVSVYTLDSNSATYKSKGVGVGIVNPAAKLHIATNDGGIPAFRIDHYDTVSDAVDVRIKSGETTKKVFGINNKGDLFADTSNIFINKKDFVNGGDSYPSIVLLPEGDALPNWTVDTDESAVTGEVLVSDGSMQAAVGSYEMYVGGSHSIFAKGKVRSSGFVESSDRRWKKNIVKISEADDRFFEKLKAINGVYYDWNDVYYKINGIRQIDKFRQIGVIAQDVKEQFPEIVDTDEKGFMAVNYSKFAPILIEAIKKIDAKIEHDKNSIYIDPDGNIDIKGLVKINSSIFVTEEGNLIANNVDVKGSMKVSNNFSIRRSDTLDNLITISSDKKADKSVKGYISAKDFYIADKNKWASEIDSSIVEIVETPPAKKGTCDKAGAMKLVDSTGELFICNGERGWLVVPTVKN